MLHGPLLLTRPLPTGDSGGRVGSLPPTAAGPSCSPAPALPQSETPNGSAVRTRKEPPGGRAGPVRPGPADGARLRPGPASLPRSLARHMAPACLVSPLSPSRVPSAAAVGPLHHRAATPAFPQPPGPGLRDPAGTAPRSDSRVVGGEVAAPEHRTAALGRPRARLSFPHAAAAPSLRGRRSAPQKFPAGSQGTAQCRSPSPVPALSHWASPTPKSRTEGEGDVPAATGPAAQGARGAERVSWTRSSARTAVTLCAQHQAPEGAPGTVRTGESGLPRGAGA